MLTKLSIIIPCFNCENTLREAVESCYIQGFTEDEFEIIMIDDGSTDRTRPLMQELAERSKNIHLIFHPENRGGGAARNTGIKEATGEIIYCLDSDNLFAPHSVKPMLTFLMESKADGVTFYERRFFVGANKKRYTKHLNKIVASPIRLLDLLNTSGTVLDNFFYTKKAYLKTNGYPEHHGFDTQCFEMRFLSAGSVTRVCPDSIFWHRQAGSGGKSYFERVYESGEYSLNMYYIFEDIMHLLSDDARRLILNFNVFSETKLGSRNIQAALVEEYKDNESALFKTDYIDYLKPNGLKTYHEKYQERDVLIHALWSYSQQDYSEAAVSIMSLLGAYPDSVVLKFNILRCAVGASGMQQSSIEKSALALSQKFNTKKQKIDLNPNPLKKIAYKFKKLLS